MRPRPVFILRSDTRMEQYQRMVGRLVIVVGPRVGHLLYPIQSYEVWLPPGIAWSGYAYEHELEKI